MKVQRLDLQKIGGGKLTSAYPMHFKGDAQKARESLQRIKEGWEQRAPHMVADGLEIKEVWQL